MNDGKSQDDFVENKVKKWIKEIEKLSEIALFQPQAAYLAFTTGLRHKYTYISRTTPNIKEHLIKLDHVINTKFLKAITEQQDLSVNERKLLSLPVSLGGLGIPIFNDLCDVEYVNSTKFSRPLTDAILTCENMVFEDISISNRRVRAEIKRERGERNKTVLQNLQSEMHVEKLRANEISQLKISSSWLTSLPIKEEGFSLSKREFFDALALRYRWNVKHLPSTCCCGKPFDVDHSMTCVKGGFIHRRHDDLRDLIAETLDEVYSNTKIEPKLQPLSG